MSFLSFRVSVSVREAPTACSLPEVGRLLAIVDGHVNPLVRIQKSSGNQRFWELVYMIFFDLQSHYCTAISIGVVESDDLAGFGHSLLVTNKALLPQSRPDLAAQPRQFQLRTAVNQLLMRGRITS